jgi:hypothetical protein
VVTEDRSKFPPDYSGQQVTDDKGTVFAWSYKDDLNPFTNPEQIGRRPPPERCQESKEACVAAAWMDHDARAMPLERTTAFLVDCVGPAAAEEANKTAQRWASRINASLGPMWESENTADKVWAILTMRMLGNLMIEVTDSIIKTVGGIDEPGGDG